MKARVRRTSWHTVQEQHRALATMGRLAAEHSNPDHPSEAHASKSAVRVVRDNDPAWIPPGPPRLRSRPRRTATPGEHPEGSDSEDPRQTKAPRAAPPPNKQVLPGPSVKLLREREPSNGSEAVSPRPHPAPRPVLPAIPPKRQSAPSTGMLRFDAIDAIDAIVNRVGQRSPAEPKTTAPKRQAKRALVARTRGLSRDLGDSSRAFSGGIVARSRALRRKASAGSQALFREAGARCRPLLSALVARGGSGIGQLRRRPRLATGVAAVILLVSALAGLLATAGGGGGSPHSPQAANVSAGHAAASPPVASGGSGAQVAQTPEALLEMTSSTSAVYQVSGPIQVVLNASGSCWIQARHAGPNGDLVFQGTLVPGQSWTVAGPTWLRLGNPSAVSLAINGETVSPPAARGIPFDLQIGSPA